MCILPFLQLVFERLVLSGLVFLDIIACDQILDLLNSFIKNIRGWAIHSE